MSKPNSKNELVDLLEFISTYSELEGGQRLFKELDNFFQSKLNTEPLYVYSRPKKLAKIGDKPLTEICRLVWGRPKKKNKKAVICHEATEKLLGIATNSIHVKEWSYHEIGNAPHYLLPLGENDTQYFFGILKTSEAIGETTLDYLNKFLVAQTSRLHHIYKLKKLESLIHLDDVTGLFNQRKMLKDLDESIERHEKLEEDFTVLFVDIDHFKTVNDGHGHLVGTQILADMAILLRNVLRETDLIYRYGGDEFVMIIRDITPHIAKVIGERVLSAVGKKEFDVTEKDLHTENSIFKLTVSIGIANFPEDAKSRDDILSMADRMMYKAKESGRGRVCHATELLSEEDEKASKSAPTSKKRKRA